MESSRPSETKQALGPERPFLDAFLGRLDGFLSESLRRAPSSELVRYRVMVGSALFLGTSCLLFLLTRPPLTTFIATAVAVLGYLLTLVLLRRASSPQAPAWLLCATVTQGLIVSIFGADMPTGGIHAAPMLLPALAVYLLGPRQGAVLTLLLAVCLGVLHPLSYMPSAEEPILLMPRQMWLLHITAALSFFGGWGLSALHTTARDEAQRTMERTLKELRESEGKLSSLVESTEDVIISMDLHGRVLTANSAAKALYLRRFGLPLEPGRPLFDVAEAQVAEVWRPRMEEVLAGRTLRFEETHTEGDARLVLDVSMSPILGEGGKVVGVTLFSRNITARKEAEVRLGEMHRTLVEVSRQAGMAEVATGVLHNVGNTLNSVNISTSLLADQLRQSRVGSLSKATRLLREHASDMATFLSTDPQGQKLPGFLVAVSEHLVEERDAMSRELRALGESVEHIKSIITMQQKHARTAANLEQLAVPRLIDEALRLHAVSFERLGITIERDYADIPQVLVDRHKLLQILINLLSNARHALVDWDGQDKRLNIRVRLSDDGQRLLIEVRDNGMGIAPENLPRMFTQGFTTKKTGHGFGLHISALAAAEMKGRLSCTSPGPGQGATFTLELPVVAEPTA